MRLESPFRLHSVSVVVTAQSHNPSILTKEFLVESGIVPKDWTATEVVNTPVLSLVRFESGVQWALDSSRLSVTENCESSFQDSYQIHGSVIEYLKKVEYVPYRSLGLNCIVAMESNEPRTWLRRRFLRDGPWDTHDLRMVSMIPRFAFDSGGATLNFAFGDQAVWQGQVQNAVSVDCNLHHEGPLNAAELRDAIARWNSHQDLIVDTLNMLSMGQQI